MSDPNIEYQLRRQTEDTDRWGPRMANDYEIEQAEANANRMSDMTDADIRTAIAVLKDRTRGLDYRIGTRMVVQAEDGEELAIYRAELLRRACAAVSLPMLSHLQMTALKQAARDGKLVTSNAQIIVLCLDLCDMGLFHDLTRDNSGTREFRLTSVASVILDNSADDAVNLFSAVRARRQIEDVATIVCADIMATAGVDASSGRVMQAAE